ncbi:MAG: murein biosynthesis integral membrane protein MurJ [Candidatus Fonsibacter sp.]|nr:murein biosynthesis integral membrane protein MurJ [Candidatus Fonsibacter sp.]
MNILKNISYFGFSTFLSRILGYLRDTLIAVFLGTSAAADALFVAFRIPNTFRSLFAEGSFNSAFIPAYAKQKGSKKNHFANQVLTLLIIFILFIIFIIEIFTPEFLFLISPGFQDINGKFDLAVDLSRITFPFLFFISISSFLSAILNSKGKFLVAAAAPIILNILLILSLIFFHSSNIEIVYAASYALTIAGIIQVIFLFFFAKKYFKINLSFIVKIDNQVKSFFNKLLPSVFASGVNQINILIGTVIASFESGAVSYLYYADRIYQLPLALTGIAIATIILPSLSKEVFKSKLVKVNFIQNRSLELCLFLSLPATVGIFLASDQIISALYGYGFFDTESVMNTSAALLLFGIGLPAFGLIKIYSSFYFARSNTKFPFYLSLFSVILNISISLVLFKSYGFLIIPLATSISAWFTVVIYQLNLIKSGYHSFDKLFAIRFIKSVLCTLIMALILSVLLKYFSNYLESKSILKAIMLILLVLLSAFIYFLTAYFLKAFRIKDLKV